MASNLIYLLLLYSFMIHPVHVTLTSIEHLEDKNEINIFFKFLKEDFTNLINEKYKFEINISEHDLNKETIDLINTYINESFRLHLNNKNKADLEFIKYKIDEEAIWLYYKHKPENIINSIKIINLLLLDNFENPTNLLIFKNSNTEKGYMLNQKKNTIELKF